MASQSREWSVPAPVRTLLWWPAISFVLVIVFPDAATSAIVFAGAALAALGALASAAARRLRQPRVVPGGVVPGSVVPGSVVPGGPADAVADAPTMDMSPEMPTMELPRVEPHGRSRAA
jgi:hypothetical protein